MRWKCPAGRFWADGGDSVIIHHVAFEWFPTVTDADVADFDTALGALPALVPELISYTHGVALRLRAGTSDYGVVALVDSASALHRYLDHPTHAAITAEFAPRMFKTRTAVQLHCAPELASLLAPNRARDAT